MYTIEDLATPAFPDTVFCKGLVTQVLREDRHRIGGGMTDALEIADYLITYSKVRGQSLSNEKLNRLLYYAQAWYLAIYAEELFTDVIEAWGSGPVIPSVYKAFEEVHRTKSAKVLSGKIRAHLDAVMVRYYSLTDDQLATLVRHEAPWIVARNTLPVDGKLVIKTDEMEIFYRYSSQDVVTKAAIFSCRMWATIQRAFSLSIHLAVLYPWHN